MSKYKAENIFASLKFAFRGLMLAVKSQRNFRTDLFIGTIVLILSVVLRFSPVEMAILLLTIGAILFAELINTVIEFIVDAYFGNKYSILAKMAKDTSAGAVLLTACICVLVGIVLFAPKLFAILR